MSTLLSSKKVYISLEDAVRAIREVPDGNWGNARYVSAVTAVRAADVVEVRHGRWVDEEYVWQGQKSAQCNQCKRKTGYYTQPEYCPNCGAKMDGGQDDVG